MHLSAKSQYACLAVMQLADSHHSGNPVQIRTIAQQHGIPQRFLVQILLQLKRAGLLASTRGSQGGYQLIRSPDDITLAEVLDAVDGTEQPVIAAANKSPFSGPLLESCQELTALQQERLARITLTSLLERAHRASEPMWYI